MELVHTTGEVIFQEMNKTLDKFHLDIKDIIGLSCEGTSSMVGEHNSVWSRLREENPSTVLYRCICYSLALAIRYTFNTSHIPSAVGFLVSNASVERVFMNMAYCKMKLRNRMQIPMLESLF